jgi:hypothetical protein
MIISYVMSVAEDVRRHLAALGLASFDDAVGRTDLLRRGTRGDDVATTAATYLARASLLGLVVGAVLGLIVGCLKWDADYRSLWLGPLSYKLHWAVIEAIFSLVLMIGWWLWLPGRARGASRAMAARCLIAVLAATNLLYHFPPLFSVAARLDDAGQVSGEQIGPAAFRRLMVAGDTPAIFLHVVLASLAVAGIMLLGLAMRWLRGGDKVGAAKIARWGAQWALVPSLLQLPVGLWTLTALPAAAQSQLMADGGKLSGTFPVLRVKNASFGNCTGEGGGNKPAGMSNGAHVILPVRAAAARRLRGARGGRQRRRAQLARRRPHGGADPAARGRLHRRDRARR